MAQTLSTERRPAVERVHPPDRFMRVVNPIMRWLLRSPFAGPVAENVLLLHFTGRKTGVRYTTPVGYRMIDGRLALLTSSRWRLNFRGRAAVQVTLQGKVRNGTATLVDAPDVVARTYASLIDEMGLSKARRRLGLRFNVERKPTVGELEHAIVQSGLSIVNIELD